MAVLCINGICYESINLRRPDGILNLDDNNETQLPAVINNRQTAADDQQSLIRHQAALSHDISMGLNTLLHLVFIA